MRIFWVAHAYRVLVLASRQNNLSKVRESGTLSPAHETRFVFISLEDETGVSNAIVDPNLFERFRLLITEEAFLLIEGEVQNSDNVVLIKTRDIRQLAHEEFVGSESHDFH